MIFRKIVTGVDFANGRPVLTIFARDQCGNKRRVDVEQLPIYFYMDEFAEISDEHKKVVVAEYGGYESIHGHKLRKVVVKTIKSRKILSDEYHGFESDVMWDKQMMLDLKVTDKFTVKRNRVKTLDERFIEQSTGTHAVTVNMIDMQGNIDEDDDFTKEIKFRICSFDLEIIAENKEDLDTMKGKIVCSVFWDSYTEEYKQFYDKTGEKDLIIEMLEWLRVSNPDIITGWNVQFDLKWLFSRAEQHGLSLSDYIREGRSFIKKYTDKYGDYHEDPVVAGKVVLDGKELYIKKTATSEKLNSYSLKAVAVAEGFPEWEDLGRSIKKEWESNKFKVLEYCRLDVERTNDIINKNNLIQWAESMAQISGAPMTEVLWNSKVIDAMAFLYKGNKVLPNIVRNRERPDVKGAEVLEAIIGIRQGVAIFDAASLYPSIMGGFNISTECVVNDMHMITQAPQKFVDVEIDGRHYYFWKKNYKLGIIPIIIGDLRKLREEVRSKRATATKLGDTGSFKKLNDEEKVLKGLLASVYGVLGYPGFRLFDEDCANAITGIARNLIYQMKKHVEDVDHKIIYGDTDSVFITVKDAEDGFVVMDKINTVLFDYVKSLGVTEQIIVVNYEKFFKWLMFIPKGNSRKEAAKKKYIGFVGAVQAGPREMKPVSELYNKGFELRRSDTAKALKYIMKEFFKLMEDGDWHKSVEFLRAERKAFNKWTMKEVAMPRAINVEDANNPWARGLRYAKEVLKLEFNEDELPKLVYVAYQTRFQNTHELCFQDHHVIPEAFKIDYTTMFDKLVRTKFEPILQALGQSWDTALEGQQTMESFC